MKQLHINLHKTLKEHSGFDKSSSALQSFLWSNGKENIFLSILHSITLGYTLKHVFENIAVTLKYVLSQKKGKKALVFANLYSKLMSCKAIKIYNKNKKLILL